MEKIDRLKIIIKQLKDSKQTKTWNQSSCVMLLSVGVKSHFGISCLQTRSSARRRGNAIPQQLEDLHGSSSGTCSVKIDQHSKGNQETDLIGCLQEGQRRPYGSDYWTICTRALHLRDEKKYLKDKTKRKPILTQSFPHPPTLKHLLII